MKKALKILGITLGTTAGIAVVAALVLCYIVLTPARLTPIVKSVADDYIACDYNLDEVELTVFKTFPDIGLSIKGLELVNPTQGAPNDTLAHVDCLTAALDLQKFLKENTIELKRIDAEGIRANVYVNKEGRPNYDVFVIESDTTDTSSSSFKLNAVNLTQLKLQQVAARYTDEVLGVDASVRDGDISLEGSITNLDTLNGKAKAKVKGLADVTYQTKNLVAQLESFDIDLDADVTDFQTLEGTLKGALKGERAQADMEGISATINDVELDVTGTIKDLAALDGAVQAKAKGRARASYEDKETKASVDDIDFDLSGDISDLKNLAGAVQGAVQGRAQAYYENKDTKACLQDVDFSLSGDVSDLKNLTGTAKASVSGMGQARYKTDGVQATVEDIAIAIDGEVTDLHQLTGQLKAQVATPHLSAAAGGVDYLKNERASVDLPVHFDLTKMHFALDSTAVQLDQFLLNLKGWATAHQDNSVDMDIQFGLKDWSVEPLLDMIPDAYQPMIDGLKASGQLGVRGAVKGTYSDHQMPKLDVGLQLKDGAGRYEGIPYDLRDVNADMSLQLDLNNMENGDLHIKNLEAKTLNSSADISGDITDLLGNAELDLLVNADAQISDFKDYIPEDIHIQGNAQGGMKVRGMLNDFANMDLQKTLIDGQFQVQQLQFDMTDLSAATPSAIVGIQVPAKNKRNSKAGWAGVQVDSRQLTASMSGLGKANLSDAYFDVQTCDLLNMNDRFISNIQFRTKGIEAKTDSLSASLAAPKGTVDIDYDMAQEKGLPTLTADISMDQLSAIMDTITVDAAKPDINVYMTGDSSDPSKIKARFDYSGDQVKAQMGSYLKATIQDLDFNGSAKESAAAGDNVLRQWNPRLQIELKQAKINMADIPMEIQVPHIDTKYSNRKFELRDSRVILGNSDFKLTGEVENIADWLSNEGKLEGDMYFTSDITDVNELMDLFSGAGVTDEKLVADMEQAEAQPDTAADPFLVPENTDLTLHTNIKKALVSNETVQDLKGDLTVKDGVVVLEEMGFVCEAARLQLTGMYKSPRLNHLFAGFDLHMLDIDIKNLIHIIPEVDSLLPMLKSFEGKAEFHLALETYMDKYYNLKPSTAIGAASITGKDLVLLDNETFTKIAKLLLFKKKTENVVDSISAEITLWNKQIDIYPFVMSIDKYKAAIGGRQNWDMSYDYHFSLLSPLRLGVNAKTNKKGKLRIVPCLPKYAKDFQPERKEVVETENRKIRDMIRKVLTRNVK